MSIAIFRKNVLELLDPMFADSVLAALDRGDEVEAIARLHKLVHTTSGLETVYVDLFTNFEATDRWDLVHELLRRDPNSLLGSTILAVMREKLYKNHELRVAMPPPYLDVDIDFQDNHLVETPLERLLRRVNDDTYYNYYRGHKHNAQLEAYLSDDQWNYNRSLAVALNRQLKADLEAGYETAGLPYADALFEYVCGLVSGDAFIYADDSRTVYSELVTTFKPYWIATS